MKALFMAMVAGLMVLPSVTANENSTDYEKGFADGYAAAVAALTGNISADQYTEIMAVLDEIRASLAAKDEPVLAAANAEPKRESKTVDLVLY